MYIYIYTFVIYSMISYLGTEIQDIVGLSLQLLPTCF